MFSEQQKVALVTGSALRIGKYLVERLASEGWIIALHYHISEREAYETAKNLLPIANVMLFKADLTNLNETEKLIPEINKQLGPVNLLINNASMFENDNIFNVSRHNLDANLNIHLNSPLLLAKAISAQNITANIINILDTDITINMKHFFSYSLSKKALFELTKMLALNLAPSIRVNAIAPGPTLFKEGKDIELFNDLIDKSPLQSKPKLEDLYDTIKYFINTESVTGQVIFLDGGRHLL